MVHMRKPSVLISGASVAGLSNAYWLARTGWDVTIIERAPAFRTGGQNIDIRGVAREVLEKMNLFVAAKEHNTTESGTVIIDEQDKTIATLPSDDADGATAELEILRGDLAQIILQALPKQVKLMYGESIEQIREKPDSVTITTKSQQTFKATLLVIAEGVRSSTRNLLFPNADVRELGITMAFGTIPRTDADNDYWRWYNTTGGRQVHLRPDNRGTIRAILAYAGSKRLAGIGTPDALAYLDEKFKDAGWQAKRVLDGFHTSDDVYVDDLAQVSLQKWQNGRTILAGDAAWCVTPIGGGGASLALTSGYVLAASVARLEDDAESNAVALALDAYEAWMRPLVKQVQKLPPGTKALAYPQTRLGLAMRNAISKIVFSPTLSRFSSKMTHVADTDQTLPVLPDESSL
jgi:2-polyprenyl-6-methoxyphenol hydroxylase-like FAD-dependent oxidoreductase